MKVKEHVFNVRVSGCVQGGGGGASESSDAVLPSGVRSVKAPAFDPSQHQTQQAQLMTCKACGMLVTYVPTSK